MGAALVKGWLDSGISPSAIYVWDPIISADIKAFSIQGVKLNQKPDAMPVLCLLAVKPQIMWQALEQVKDFMGCCFISIAAGITLPALEQFLGQNTPIIRAMPNTPAAIGKSMTALVGNAQAGASLLALAQNLFEAVGEVVMLEHENQMDAITAISGSGPAYIFHFIEAMIAAGIKEGLAPDLAQKLVLVTCEGAIALARFENEDVRILRENVTSPGGTTAAALSFLMNETNGLKALIQEAVSAAAKRSKELSK